MDQVGKQLMERHISYHFFAYLVMKRKSYRLFCYL